MSAADFSSQENKAAFRTAIASVLATFIAFELHLESPYWAGMSAVIVSSLYSGSIIDKAIMRFMGTLFGAIIGVWLASQLVNDLYSYLFSCFIIVAASTWYFHTSHYAYAWPLLSMAALMVLSQLAFTPDNTLNTAIWRSVEIALGVFTAAIASLYIFPISLRDAMLHQQHLLFGELIDCISILKQQIEQSSADHVPLRKAVNALKSRCHQSSELIELMRSEPGLNQLDIEQYRASIDTFFRAARLLLSFEFEEHAPIPPAYAAHLEQFVNHLTEVQHRHQDKHSVLLPLNTLLGRDECSQNTFFYLLSHLQHCIVKIESLMEGHGHTAIQLREPRDVGEENGLNLMAVGHGQESPEFTDTLSPQLLYPQAELFRRSLKSGLAVVLALLFWLINPSSGGLSGITSSVSISVRKSLYDMKQIAWHRLLGCLAGGGIALAVLAMVELNTRLLMVVLFGFIYFFSYLAYRYAYYMYLGQQACLALVICLAQGGGPALTLSPVIDRLSGILIAIFASFFIVNIFWRTDNVHFLKTELERLHGYVVDRLEQIVKNPENKTPKCNLTELFWMCRKTLNELVSETIKPSREKLLQKLELELEDEALLQAGVCQLHDEVDLTLILAFSKEKSLPMKSMLENVVAMLRTGCSQAEYETQCLALKKLREANEQLNPHPGYLDFIVCCDVMEMMMNIAKRRQISRFHHLSTKSVDNIVGKPVGKPHCH